MKQMIFCFLLVTLGIHAQTGTMKFSGKIANRNSDMITISGGTFKKTVPVGKDGGFSASFEVPEGIYQFYDGTEYTELYLKNGFDLNLIMDAKQFDESIVYTGNGAKENNLLAKKALDEEALETKVTAVQNDPEAFSKLLRDYGNDLNAKMTAEGIDPGLKKAYDEKTKADMEKQRKMREERELQLKESAKMVGNASPSFDYENHKGGKTKLEDFRGKYVYIDNWATWCGPCRAEIPFLQKVEEKYKGKNIEFVSISVDVQKDHDKWKKMVDEKSLGGTQLIADNNWNSDFIKAYGINSIPRFILIGPDGKVIDADAKRPSDNALQVQLDSLLK